MWCQNPALLQKRTPKSLFADQSGTQARHARAPHHAVCGRSVSYGRALRQREASTLRCKAALRRASRVIQRTAALHVHTHAIVSLRSLSLGRRRSRRARHTRARRAALVILVPYRMKGHYTSERALSFDARPCCDVPAAVSRKAGLSVCTHAIATLRLLSLGRRRSTCARGACSPHRAGCNRSMPFEGHCTSEKALSFGAKPCSDVPAAASRAASLRVCAHAIAPLRSLSLRRKRITRACGARAPRRAGCCWSLPYESTLH